jgi:hypothetical protein
MKSSTFGKSAFSTTFPPAERIVCKAVSKASIGAGEVPIQMFRGMPTVIPLRSFPLQKVVKSGIGSNEIFQVLSSRSFRPAILLSKYAASLTVLVRVPMTSCRLEMGIAPSVPIKPRLGLKPTMLLSSAGPKMLPHVLQSVHFWHEKYEGSFHLRADVSSR